MIGPNGNGHITAVQLDQVYWAIDHMVNLEGQDRTMVIEMAQAMLNDLIEIGALSPMAVYVRKFCDVIGSAEEADQIAADITASG